MELTYFDYAATGPVRPEAAAAVAEELCRFGNPSSRYPLGREAALRVKGYRAQVAAAMGCAVIRLDTWAGNIPAATLYQKNGFSLCGRAQVLFQGKIPEELVFLEYRCPPSADPPAVCGS